MGWLEDFIGIYIEWLWKRDSDHYVKSSHKYCWNHFSLPVCTEDTETSQLQREGACKCRGGQYFSSAFSHWHTKYPTRQSSDDGAEQL